MEVDVDRHRQHVLLARRDGGNGEVGDASERRLDVVRHVPHVEVLTLVIDGVIEGVELDLVGTSDQPVTVSVTQDLESIVSDRLIGHGMPCPYV